MCPLVAVVFPCSKGSLPVAADPLCTRTKEVAGPTAYLGVVLAHARYHWEVSALRRSVPILTALLVAVGVAAYSVPVGAQSATPTYVQGITFRAPVRMTYTDPAQVGGPGEPSMKVDAAGTIYTAGVCCVTRAAPAWYSQDGGLTFTDLPSPGSAREHGLGAEGDFIVDDADGVYFADTWIPSIIFTRWSGHGDVWEYTEDTAIGVIPGLDDRPWLAYSHGNVYMYINHGTHITVYKTTDGGHTWDDAFTTLGRGQQYWTGHVSADRRTDDVYLFGANCTLGQMCAASSHDAGATWTEVAAGTLPRGGRADFMVASDVDEAGNVYGTFVDTNASGCDVQLAVSTDKGATWHQYRVNPEVGCATFPWVVAGDDGRVALSWYYNSAKKSQNTVPATSEWRMQSAVITGADTESPVVTYGTLDRVIHRGPLNRELWDFQQVALGPDGRFHVIMAEDFEAPCAGNLSTQGGAAAYQNMCTTYVGQASGPRLVQHAADQTSVDSVSASSLGDTISVDGGATFGRAAPMQVITDGSGDALPGIDIRKATVVREHATSEELVVELSADGIPEAASGAGNIYEVQLSVGGTQRQVRMIPRPWSFQLCGSAGCTRIRGDVDPGSDRLVARVPLALLGAAPGDAISVTGASAVTNTFAGGTPTIDQAPSNASYTVPGPTVTVSVTDGAGNVVASGPGALSEDLSSFSASLGGLAPGTYSVSVEACFAANCASSVTGNVIVA